MIRPTFNRIRSATTDESRLKFSSTGLPITSLTYLHKQMLCTNFINKLFVNVYDAPLLPQHHTSTYSTSPVLIFRASRSALGCGFVFTIRRGSQSYDMSASTSIGSSSLRNTATMDEVLVLFLSGLQPSRVCWRGHGCRLETGQGAGCLDSYLILSLGYRS